MELVLDHPDNRAIEPTKDLVVVVACEAAATAPRACELLERIGRSAGVEGRLIYSWWTFAVLASASLRQLAASEAAAADMIMIAAREGPGLPEAVKDWISLCLASREQHLRPRALVALLESGKKPNGASCGVLSELKQLAELGAVDFFANGDQVKRNAVLTRAPALPSGNRSWCASNSAPRIVGRGGRVAAGGVVETS
jgi:hypothetical protein